MPSFVRPYYSVLWIALQRIVSRFHDLFGLIFSSIQRRLLVRSTKKPKESTVSPSVGLISPMSQTSTCPTFTIKPQPQTDLDILGVGAAGQVYRVDDDIVLKTCRVYEPPGDGASPRERWFYASETLFHFNLMRDERTVLRLLEHLPHPNIVEAIDTDRAEGVYLRKYLRLSELDSTPQSVRIRWYHDIIRALLHIHDLNIAHSDVRIDNILFDHQARAVLCDFSASSPFGHRNPALPHTDLPVPINGLSEFVSDATDRFAFASLIFQMETGTKPELSVDDSGALVLPRIQTGLSVLDTMIQKAWLGQYNSTAHMLKDADALHRNITRDLSSTAPRALSRELLRDHIRHWREHREKCLGNPILNCLCSIIFF
jgi:serine/threonine protein kinase